MGEEEKHNDFRRHGADLYIERSLSLVEALCGFELAITHLDDRQLIIKSAKGDVIRPMPRGFDPFAPANGTSDWEVMPGMACPSIPDVASARVNNVDAVKEAVETQLKT